MKDPSPKQQLLEAVSSKDASDAEVQTLIDKLQEESPEKKPAASAKTQGKWRLLWSMQVTYAGFSTLTPVGFVMLLHACLTGVSDMNIALGECCITCSFHSFFFLHIACCLGGVDVYADASDRFSMCNCWWASVENLRSCCQLRLHAG